MKGEAKEIIKKKEIKNYKDFETKQKKIREIIILITIYFVSSIFLAHTASAQNTTYNYVWNGTDWIPWLATSEGKPYVYLDLINITGNRLVVNQTAYIIGKLGVGASSPSEKLEVAGNILASGYVYGTTGLCIANDCKTSWSQVGGISPWDNSTTQIFVREGYPTYVNVSNALFVNGTSGNVGIGTTSPELRLHVVGDGSMAASFMNGNVGIGTNAPSEKLEVQGRVLVASSYPFELQPSDLILDVNGSINASNYVYGVQGLRIGENTLFVNGTNGNVGIGTASPQTKLHIQTSAIGEGMWILGNGYSPQLVFGDTGSTYLTVQWMSGATPYGLLQTYISGSATGNLVLQGGGGNVGIGTTGPSGKLHVSGGNAIFDGNVGIGTTAPDVKLDVDGDIEGELLSTGSTVAVYAVSGGANGGTYKLVRYSSSERYKENISDFNLGLETVMKLRPVEFNWKSNGEKDFGFIAEEVEKVNPFLITYVDGKPEAFRYAQYTAILTNAIKEQQNQISSISEQITSLSELAALTVKDGNVGIGTTDPGSYKLYVNGSFYATSKSSSANTSKGEVLFYSEEAAEHWFKDYGKAKLVNGVAKVYLDPIYAEAISDKEDYMIFITLEDDCNGVYIADKTKEYFIVKELRNGNSNASFVYQIVGKRKGYEGIRLEPLRKDEKN